MPEKLNSPGNHNQGSLNDCKEKSPLQEDLNIDDVPTYPCEDRDEHDVWDKNAPTLKSVGNEIDLGWLEDVSTKKTGLGTHGLCDPMQTGQIVNDVEKPNRNTIYRYSKGLRATDEAMLDMFRNITILDEDGKAHPVPIIWATQERAVAIILQENVRKDESLVVDRVKLPMMAIYSSSITPNQKRYTYHKAEHYARRGGKPAFTASERYEKDTVFGVTRGIPVDIGYNLWIWTGHLEDVSQIFEQIITKFSPNAYIRVRGVWWETPVYIESIANNMDIEVGDKKPRVIKFQFNLKAETYIPQPLIRKKAVLKTKIDIFDSVNNEEIDELLVRLEEAVEELKE